MMPLQPRKNGRPESKIQDAIHNYLTERGWYCCHTHGSTFQAGLPDCYVTHQKYAGRWLEVKLPEMKGSRFTPAQLKVFPLLTSNGTGIWVLTGANDIEYAKLFKPPNWHHYLIH